MKEHQDVQVEHQVYDDPRPIQIQMPKARSIVWLAFKVVFFGIVGLYALLFVWGIIMIAGVSLFAH
jgi:hypothetical protein